MRAVRLVWQFLCEKGYELLGYLVFWTVSGLALGVIVSACTSYLGDDRQVVDKGVGISWSWPTGAGGAVDNSASAVRQGDYLVKPSALLSVYDGDTFFIRLTECSQALPWLCERMAVRIAGVDAPEMRGECAEERALAVRSRDMLRALLDSVDGPIVLTGVRREKYGRLLASVRVGPMGHDVAQLLIRTGAVRAYASGPRQGWCATQS